MAELSKFTTDFILDYTKKHYNNQALHDILSKVIEQNDMELCKVIICYLVSMLDLPSYEKMRNFVNSYSTKQTCAVSTFLNEFKERIDGA